MLEIFFKSLDKKLKKMDATLTELSKANEEKETKIIQKLEPFINGKVGMYVPIKGEVNCFDEFKRYKQLYLPIVEDEQTMNFY